MSIHYDVRQVQLNWRSCSNQQYCDQRILTYFVRGSITVLLASSLTGFDSEILRTMVLATDLLVWLNTKCIRKGQPYIDTCHYKVSDYWAGTLV